MVNYAEIETVRSRRQVNLDSLKTQKERNTLGQFSTPKALADSIVTHTTQFLHEMPSIKFIDPALGTGVFFSSIMASSLSNRLKKAIGFEVDTHYGVPAQKLWSETILDIHLNDFTECSPPETAKQKYNLLICNPPYVRHHHLKANKDKLRNQARKLSDIQLSGLSGLYCYFMAIAHSWMAQDSVLTWLIPSEFMDVNYGLPIKNYLLQNVELLQIHRFDPTNSQFDDALVSSCVVWYRMRKPEGNHQVKFTFGNSLEKPSRTRFIGIKKLLNERKWTRFPRYEPRNNHARPTLGDYFSTKRGIATGSNKFFILSREELESKNLPIDQFRPILPSPRHLKAPEVKADENGYPINSQRLFVLNCYLTLNQIKEKYPTLHSYLQMGMDMGVHSKYLCKNRKTWYFQENRTPSQFYCTYIGRSTKNKTNPFRFILNRSKAIVSNSYLILYPKPNLEALLVNKPNISHKIFEALNNITGRAMSEEGRVYGGGMYKLEPRELVNVSALELERVVNSHLT